MDERLKEVLSDAFINKLFALNHEEINIKDVLYHVLFISHDSAFNALEEHILPRGYSQSITECVREIMVDIVLNEMELQTDNNRLKKIVQL